MLVRASYVSCYSEDVVMVESLLEHRVCLNTAASPPPSPAVTPPRCVIHTLHRHSGKVWSRAPCFELFAWRSSSTSHLVSAPPSKLNQIKPSTACWQRGERFLERLLLNLCNTFDLISTHIPHKKRFAVSYCCTGFSNPPDSRAMSASPAIKLNCRWSLEASSFSWFCQPTFVFYAPVDRNVCKKAALCGRNVEFCRLLSRFPPLENVSAGSLWSHGCCFIYRVVRGGDSDPACRQRRYEFESVAWNYKIAGRCSGEDESLFCHIYVAKDAT